MEHYAEPHQKTLQRWRLQNVIVHWCRLFLWFACFRFKKTHVEYVVNDDKFIIKEQKTSKRRVVKINADFQKHIQQCFDALEIQNMNEACFLSRKNMVMSTQRINVRLKEIKKKYNIKIDNFSCHSLRKAFGRKIFESSGENAQMALVKLSELFNHSSVQITKIYLGLREKELLETYDLLDF